MPGTGGAAAQQAQASPATTTAPTTATTPAPAGAEPARNLRIGSKRFTESYILAELLAQQVARRTGQTPAVSQGLGNTAIVYQALQSGGIGLYPEYTGTIAMEILKSDKPMSLEDIRTRLAPLGLGVDIPFGFNDGYALAMRAADADRLGIRSLSDLARHPDQRLGLSQEFIGRVDGWRGLAQRYGLRQSPTGLDHGLAYDAIEKRQVDVIDIYTTDAKIDALGLRVLEDDLKYFPRYDAVVLYRLDLPQRYPQAWAAMRELAGTIDEHAMIAMNARAELQGVPFDVIARDRLAAVAGTAGAQNGLGNETYGFWRKLMGPDLGRLAAQHLMLVLLSVAIAVVVAVPAGVYVYPRYRLRALVLGMTGLLQTIPSLAMLAILITVTGRIGSVPALAALTLYALLPVMRNTVAGLDEVSSGMRLAATALGMTPRQRVMLIELPLARPTILAGVRTATSISIGTATIAAFIGAGGFGERIVTGLALNDGQLLLAGALPAAAMALASELAFELADRRLRRQTGRYVTA
ncbi:amino acid ABC transporter permease [Bordetella genomosp. 8]|uniref:Amino acid ABC transporter permease n=2 Tax=Bordetella genomosp. 8 TaxID=1416806 RepID=A0A1W6YTL5_9BORD|nr:amino acid ABC transporter permease [Bordetella genomosp. 8]